MLGAPITETVFEPRVGGNIVDRASRRQRVPVGADLAFDPPDRVVFSWDISPRWTIETDRLRPARSRCGSTPSRRPAPGSSWSTGTSTGTVPDGKQSPSAWTGRTAGRCTWNRYAALVKEGR
jgi:hypothetical protein